MDISITCFEQVNKVTDLFKNIFKQCVCDKKLFFGNIVEPQYKLINITIDYKKEYDKYHVLVEYVWSYTWGRIKRFSISLSKQKMEQIIENRNAPIEELVSMVQKLEV